MLEATPIFSLVAANPGARLVEEYATICDPMLSAQERFRLVDGDLVWLATPSLGRVVGHFLEMPS